MPLQTMWGLSKLQGKEVESAAARYGPRAAALRLCHYQL